MPRHTSSLSSSRTLSSTLRRKTLSRLLSASHISTQKGLSCPRYTRYPDSQPIPITSRPIHFSPHKPGSAETALPGLWGDFSLKGKRGHAQAAELAEPTKCVTKRKRQSVRRSVGPPPYAQEIFSYGLCGFRGLGDWLAWMAPTNEIREIRVIRS